MFEEWDGSPLGHDDEETSIFSHLNRDSTPFTDAEYELVDNLGLKKRNTV